MPSQSHRNNQQNRHKNTWHLRGLAPSFGIAIEITREIEKPNNSEARKPSPLSIGFIPMTQKCYLGFPDHQTCYPSRVPK
jgi:hypothetical protein